MLRRCLACAMLLLATPMALAAIAVQALEVESATEQGARIRLKTSGPVSEKILRLDNPARLVLDLPGTRMAGGVKLPASAGPVASFRTGTQPGQTLRLVMQLRASVPYRVHELPAERGGGFVIEFGNAVTAAGRIDAPVTPVAVQARHAPEDSGRDIIVAIDAGHGGQDPGASGKTGTREKDVVLAIARALKKRIDAEPGMRAILTRNDDHYIPHRERIAIARNGRADMFVSVHADAIANRDVTGSSVYILNERGATSEAARWLAERENAADLKGGVSLGDQSDQLASVLMDLSQDASMGSSIEAAQRVLTQLDQVGTIRKSQVQQANFLVLKAPDIPSMLVETAYISNPGEERKLRSSAYQAELAEAIFRGVREHFRHNPPDGTLYARQQKSRSSAPIIAASPAP